MSKGMLFGKKNIAEAFGFIEKIGYPVVIKSVNSAHGHLVFIGLKNKKDCDFAIRNIFQEKKFILAEKEFKEKEYRFVMNRDKVFAVINRDPVNVVGDGIHTIKELVKVKKRFKKEGKIVAVSL